jgi:hypothetical protein
MIIEHTYKCAGMMMDPTIGLGETCTARFNPGPSGMGHPFTPTSMAASSSEGLRPAASAMPFYSLKQPKLNQAPMSIFFTPSLCISKHFTSISENN